MESLIPIRNRCIRCNGSYWYALDGYSKPNDWTESDWSFREDSFSKSLAYCKRCHTEIQKENEYAEFLKEFGKTKKQQRENFRKLSKSNKVMVAINSEFPSNKCINCGMLSEYDKLLKYEVGRKGRNLLACSEECWDEYEYHSGPLIGYLGDRKNNAKGS